MAVICQQEDALKSHLTEAGPQTALAKLVDPTCTRGPNHLSFEPAGTSLNNVDLVNAWIQSVTEIGEVGTDLSSEADAINTTVDDVLAAIAGESLLGIPIPSFLQNAILPTTALLAAFKLSQPDNMHCRDLYDYDMGLVGLIRVLYLFGPAMSGGGPTVPRLTPATLDHAIKFLFTQTGGVDEWRDHPHLCGIEIPVPETENHIWMTESSRYLSNQLIRNRTNPLKVPSIDAMTKNRYVNDKNGLTSRILQRLARILSDDFHEYNARPYARLTAKALENLHDFAEDRRVRRGAKMALDYISAKFATSSTSSRRSVPYRRLPEKENVTTLLSGDADEETWRFIQLVGVTDVLKADLSSKLDNGAAGPMLVTATSRYRVPPLIENLITDRPLFFQRYKHEAYELYFGHPRFLISAGGIFRPGWDPDFWDHVAIDAAISALIGNPILGPLLGETAGQSLINSIAEKNAASALPTTLLPQAHGIDRNHLIRIEGSRNRELRNNTCVSSPGFACGLNPVLPPEFKRCTKRVGRNWFFVDLTVATCENDGIYVVFWRSPCDGTACSEHALGNTPSYGFFEVIEPSLDITLNFVIRRVLANNAGRRFSSQRDNIYTTFNGTDITFRFDVPVDTWPISDPKLRKMADWHLADGEIVNNLYPDIGWRKSCVEIDNYHLARRRILDFHNPEDPRWCEIDIKPFVKYGCAREPCPPSDLD